MGGDRAQVGLLQILFVFGELLTAKPSLIISFNSADCADRSPWKSIRHGVDRILSVICARLSTIRQALIRLCQIKMQATMAILQMHCFQCAALQNPAIAQRQHVREYSSSSARMCEDTSRSFRLLAVGGTARRGWRALLDRGGRGLVEQQHFGVVDDGLAMATRWRSPRDRLPLVCCRRSLRSRRCAVCLIAAEYLCPASLRGGGIFQQCATVKS